jgi:outer membrane biogenesis lipoprotein LolB
LPRQKQTAVVALIALITTACAARMFVPPAGPGVPAPDAAAAWTAATERCRTVTTFAPTLRLSGRVAGSRVPGLTVLAAVTATGGIRLQATAASRTIFELAGTNDRATFFWREDNRVATARADELVNELIGLKLGADALLPILTGCVTRSTTVTPGARYGDLLAISTDSGRVFLRQDPAGWRARYGEVEGLKIEYRWQAGPWPREIVIAAQQGTPSEVRLVVRIDDGAIVDAPLGPQTFTLNVPASATPMTLAELRALLRDW